jgi:hypothetical protein
MTTDARAISNFLGSGPVTDIYGHGLAEFEIQLSTGLYRYAGMSNGQSQSSLNAIPATKAAKNAYDEVKIAIAAAGHLAPSSRQTM